MFNAFLGVGQMTAPIFGSFMDEMYGFRFTCDVVMLVTVVYSITFLFIGNGA